MFHIFLHTALIFFMRNAKLELTPTLTKTIDRRLEKASWLDAQIFCIWDFFQKAYNHQQKDKLCNILLKENAKGLELCRVVHQNPHQQIKMIYQPL